MSRRVTMGAGSALLLVLLLATASTATAAPSIGISWKGTDPAMESGEEWAVTAKSGASIIRTDLDQTVFVNRGWTFYDKVFENAWKQGITILPILLRSDKEFNTRFPTAAEYPAWKVWVEQAVKRYGVGGEFWVGKANPTPAKSWEVWNEPNLAAHNPVLSKTKCKELESPYNSQFESCPQPGNYGNFLVATSAAIRNAQKGFTPTVLFGGLYMPAGMPYPSFLQDAASVPGGSTAYDGVAIHPYAFFNRVPELQEMINEVRFALDNHVAGGAGKPLWITELGWPVAFGDASHPAVKDEAEQASLLTSSFNWLKGVAAAKNIQAIVWYTLRDNNLLPQWDMRTGLRDEVGNFRRSWFAFQEEAGAPRWPRPIAAFQANTGTLFTYNQVSGTVNTVLGMKAGTSPSIGQYQGSHMVAFQANTGNLLLYRPSGTVNTELAMKAGTSPAISSLEDGAVAFQANTGHLWLYVPSGPVRDTELPMAAGTSPSITTLPRLSFPIPTRYVIAFQGSNGNLWIREEGDKGETETFDTKLAMAPGTSPSIASIDSGSGGPFVVTFQANTGALWIYVPGGTQASTGLGMAAGSSPTVTSRPSGKFAIAFQANTGTLWRYQPEGEIANTGFGMQAGTSPSVTGLPEDPYYGPFKVAMNAGTGSLWTYEPGGFVVNSILGNEPGTSPSIAPG